MKRHFALLGFALFVAGSSVTAGARSVTVEDDHQVLFTAEPTMTIELFNHVEPIHYHVVAVVPEAIAIVLPETVVGLAHHLIDFDSGLSSSDQAPVLRCRGPTGPT